MNKLILASSSPRRAELLKQLGFSFGIHRQDYDESISCSPDQAALYLAQKKNDQIEKDSDKTYITADTIVLLDEQILGKPDDSQQAEKMLQSLSGKSHEVITGVCISNVKKKIAFQSITKVWFNEISNQAIKHYVEKYQPFDKAGAYGIQEWIGLTAVRKIDGSYFNVVGLPTSELYLNLLEFGFK